MSETKHTPIPGYPGYAASRDGIIYSVSHDWRGYGERALCITRNFSGYASVRLSIGGKRIHLPIHKLIAATFLPPKPSDATAQIRHLDGDRMSPRASNLAWGTAADNAADREQHGRTSRSLTHSLSIKAGIASSNNSYWRHAR